MQNTVKLDKLSPEQKMLETIEIGGAALEKAASQLQSFEKSHNAACGAIPATTDALVAAGLIEESRRAECMSKLASHAVCLQLLTKLAQEKQTVAPVGVVKAASAGQQTKRASADVDARFNAILRGQTTL